VSDKNNKTLKPGWRRVKFGDVVRLSKARSQDPLADGIERYVGLEHLEPGDLRIRSWGSVADGVTFTSVFQPGQVLFGKRRAYQRKVAVADFSGVCSGDIYVLETKDAQVLLPELLPFICQTDAFFDHAVGTSAGSLSPRTNWTSLADFEFALPAMSQQERLVEELAAMDSAIGGLEQVVEHANLLKEALAKHHFGGSDGKKSLGSVCELIRDGTHAPPQRTDCGPLLLGVTNLIDGRLQETPSDTRVSEDFYSKMHRSWEPKVGDVLLAIVGATIGKTALVPESFPKFSLQRSVAVLRGIKGRLDNRFLRFFLASRPGQRSLWSKVHQTAQPGLYLKDLGSILISDVSIADQLVIANQVDEIETAINGAQTRIAALKAIRFSSLNEALSAGEVSHV
jgi:type I restriction enzyme S subunit